MVKKLGLPIVPIVHEISSYLPNNLLKNHGDKLCLQLPMDREKKFTGFVDLVEVNACFFFGTRKLADGKIPSDM